MPYLVLARKWRPQTFEEVVGQQHVTRTLQNAIRSNRIAHAYLFTGARGVGKTSIARILAKALNCLQGLSPSPCNECSNCKEITQGNAVDVLEIDGASNRGIDSIRELRETVRYRPAKSRFKIYIIDEVHMLTTEAFNALLKTLEEPPEHVLFIFATTEPHKIPATILSRCQRFDFRRIPLQQLATHLKEIALAEEANLSESILYAVAREADGSMRDAQSLLEQLLAFSRDGLPDSEVLDILGVVDRQSIHRVGEAILNGDGKTCLQVVEDIYRRGIDSRRFCQQLCDHFRNLLFLSLAGDKEGASQLDLPVEERELLGKQAAHVTPDSLYLYFQMILRGEEEIRRSSLPRISLEMLLLRLSQLPRLQSLNGLVDRLTTLESMLSGPGNCIISEDPPEYGPKPAATVDTRPQRAPSDTSSIEEAPPQDLSLSSETASKETSGPIAWEPQAPVSITEAADNWSAFLQWLERKDGILWAKLNLSRLTPLSESNGEIEIPEIYENALSEPHAIARLKDAMGEFFGRTFQIRFRNRASLQPETPEKGTVKISPKRMVMEHPIVQQALEILGGELLDIRISKQEPAGRGRTTPTGNARGGRGLASSG